MFIYWFWLKNAKIIQKMRIIFAYLQFLLYFCGAKLVHFIDKRPKNCKKSVLLYHFSNYNTQMRTIITF